MDEEHRRYNAGKYDVDMKRYEEGGHTKQIKEGMLEVIERMGGGLVRRHVIKRDKTAITGDRN